MKIPKREMWFLVSIYADAWEKVFGPFPWVWKKFLMGGLHASM